MDEKQAYDEPPDFANMAVCVTIAANESLPPPVLGSTRQFSRKNRVYCIRDFLLETYKGYLEKGSIVLDVAGGKGDLSWILTNVDDLDSVVADPRLTKHSHLLKSIEYLRSHPEEASARAVRNKPTHQPLATLLPELEGKTNFLTPRHLRLLVDADLVEAVQEVLTDPISGVVIWEEYWTNASVRALASQPLGYRENGNPTERQILSAADALAVIHSIQLIVGFHPDQATEACIDLALLLGVPFCVCPCCVFPSEFPDRTTEDGIKVRTYDDFLPYLERKHVPIRRAILNFPETKTARNIVLYTLHKDMSTANATR